jgi:hypothetical protein
MGHHAWLVPLVIILESGVKIAISGLDRLQAVNLVQDVVGQIL